MPGQHQNSAPQHPQLAYQSGAYFAPTPLAQQGPVPRSRAPYPPVAPPDLYATEGEHINASFSNFSFPQNRSAPRYNPIDDPSILEANALPERNSWDVLGQHRQIARFAPDVGPLSDDGEDTLAGSRSGSSENLPTMASLRRQYKRSDSLVSIGGDSVYDADDPRVTGEEPNQIDAHRREAELEGLDKDRRPSAALRNNVLSFVERRRYLVKLGTALTKFGAPGHKVTSQVAGAAVNLKMEATIIPMGETFQASFGNPETGTSENHIITAKPGLSLDQLRDTHQVYKAVVHNEIGAVEGIEMLNKILRAPPAYSTMTKFLPAFLAPAIICPMAFDGSLIEMPIAGACGMLLFAGQSSKLFRTPTWSHMFEIVMAILVSFAARGFHSIPGHRLCYSSLSSSGIVLILPGFRVLIATMELQANMTFQGGGNLIGALMYSLILGYCLNAGSDLFFFLDSPERHERAQMISEMSQTIPVHGLFKADNVTNFVDFAGTVLFGAPLTDIARNDKYQYQVDGCYRGTDWPWYYQSVLSLSPYALFALVPAFVFCLAVWVGQPWKRRQTPIMVAIACASFTGNKLASLYFPKYGVANVLGALIVGVLGNVYGQVFDDTAYTIMIPGVLVLVPSGISVVGGLSSNDQMAGQGAGASWMAGLVMVQVAIQLAIGLLMSSALVGGVFALYAKLRGKPQSKAIFAF